MLDLLRLFYLYFILVRPLLLNKEYCIFPESLTNIEHNRHDNDYEKIVNKKYVNGDKIYVRCSNRSLSIYISWIVCTSDLTWFPDIDLSNCTIESYKDVIQEDNDQMIGHKYNGVLYLDSLETTVKLLDFMNLHILNMHVFNLKQFEFKECRMEIFSEFISNHCDGIVVIMYDAQLIIKKHIDKPLIIYWFKSNLLKMNNEIYNFYLNGKILSNSDSSKEHKKNFIGINRVLVIQLAASMIFILFLVIITMQCIYYIKQ